MVAGMFYPADAGALRREVDQCLKAAQVSPAGEQVRALVVPHAGYMYSGATAGFSYARARGKCPTRVVLLGRSHRYHFEGPSVFTQGVFETPVADFPIDETFAAELAGTGASDSEEAHYAEHSLEVQLPFVHAVFGTVPIVPVLFGSDADDTHITFGRRLAAMLDSSDLVVASTDLSHYYPQEAANRLDKATLDAVLEQDCETMCRGFREDRYAMCGAPAVVATMACALARAAAAWRLLDYRTSADASGDYHRVVGYGAISMETAA